MDLKTYLEQEGVTQTVLAERMSAVGRHVTQGAVSQWLRKRVPPDRVHQLSQATGGKIRPEHVRPDLFRNSAA
jgi:DNA-binding transcriptional regulator YdaS (Cro superfamily)